MRTPCSHQAGMTMPELMIGMALGLIVAMAAAALLASSKASHAAQEDGYAMQETARHALELIAYALRHAGHEDWDAVNTAVLAGPDTSAALDGLDNRSLKESDPGIEMPLRKSVNGSDVLAVRFTGSGDGTVLNCGGFPVAGSADVETGRGWSIFYVAADKYGEPELRCKYFGKTSWTSEAVARGVESFQVLYGIDTDADGLPNRFVSAGEVEAMDERLRLEGPNAQVRAADLRRKTFWKKVVAVRIGLLMRGQRAIPLRHTRERHDLFGAGYAQGAGAQDAGSTVLTAQLPLAERNRLRKTFGISVQLRTTLAGAGA